ncbi:hypothetical protein CW751_12480 [Brumimicrobium salinarum]|uniref:TonB C-terminal domain-containing protein n=1 Tax=Brumimicrobium salinarum TaxID=2058658 RepID=A0A2I0QZW9_9FLAO|nr:hypothetical protein [Brumimicrobium salinarum]PKR79894.1 hypothetical protein CW751_12480 [Brumimicrobium salinarum]
MAKVPVVRKSDNRKGIVAAIAFLLVTLFLLFFIKYSEPDPPKVTVPIPITMSESGIEDFEIHNAGGGSPSETVNPTPTPNENPQEQPTQEESPVETASGTGDTESENSSEQEEAASNPFSNNGDGGTGENGSGGGFGNDQGPGSGDGEEGTGGAGDRIRKTNIQSKPTTENDERVQIALKLTIDSQGKVVRADVVRNATTSNNQLLIDEIIDLVKKEVRYEEKPGARNEVAFYTVTVQPG